MSGHSRWHKVRQYKGGIDAKRASSYTKLARNVAVAARLGGGNSDFNFSLRMAIERAKAVSVPKDVIDRAIKRGTGDLDGAAAIVEVVYECFGPGKVGMVITCQTDNNNRTSSDLKSIVTKNGYTMASQNAVAWNFDHLGVIYISNEKLVGKNFEELELAAIDAGAKDIKKDEEDTIIYVEIADLHKTVQAINALGIEISETNIEYVPKDSKQLTPEEETALQDFIEVLNENDDVDQVFHNAA